MELKFIPLEITKSRLVGMYECEYTEAQIRRDINTIIIDNRKNEPEYKSKIDQGKPISVHKIRQKEFLEFARMKGWPKGYDIPVIYKDEFSEL